MDSLQIGQAVTFQNARGFVSAIKETAAQTFTIGARGMVRDGFEIEIVWEAGRVEKYSENLVANWIRDGLPPVPVEDIPARRAEALAKMEETRRERMAADEARREREKAYYEDARQRVPAWAKAVIIAELERDDSDSMTDYFNTQTTRRVIIGFSSHTRDLFPELRKAAATFPETAHLADAPESAEHRQKYSGGAGYFLKAGNTYSDGWTIRKRVLFQGVQSLPVAEWHLTEPAAATPAPATGGAAIERHTHTKHGFDMFIVTMSERVERETFDSMLATAKGLGGWYSRKWGTTPAGFAFKDEVKAGEFLASISADAPKGDSDQTGEAVARPAVGSKADKFRELADNMQGDIDHKFAPRLANTPKRQREAASARQEGDRLKRTQAALRALADLCEAGTVPPELARVKSKADVYKLMAEEIDRTHSSYYDAGIQTGRPSVDSPAARALWAMIGDKSEAEKRAYELRRMTDKLMFSSIPGYFPTPRPIVERMIEAADIPADSACDILEPEAGSGGITDILQEVRPRARIKAYEVWSSLREILKLKGVELIGDDFTEAAPRPEFDYVLMNPPFERLQDAEHVRHAFEFLKPGGRLVAIMSPSAFFSSERKAVAFRAWFADNGGSKTDLPANAFKESGTGTATVLITVERSA